MQSLDNLPERIKSIYSSVSREEQRYLKQILIELSTTGTSPTYENIWLADFKEVPVSIDTFICDPYYLGSVNRNGEAVYPFWRETLRDIFNSGNKYNEIILSGATRIGKTSTAVIILAYMLYRLMLYRDPHSYFKKKQVSKFTIIFANLTKELAEGVAYREFNDTLKASPFFNDHGKFSRSDRKFYYIPEGDNIDIIAVSDASQALGMQSWAVMMDETNFAKAGVKDINKAKAHMKALYDTVNARISGTFRIGGEVYGKLIAASSKNTDSDFLSDHIEKQLNSGNTHLYLVDEPQWKILPKSMFSDDRFYFTVGDRYKRGFVVPKENEDEAHLQEYREQGYQVIEAPAELRNNFLADYDISLRDIAGISVVGSMGFITQEAITPVVSQDRKNPFFTDTIQIGSKDNATIQQYFHMEVVPSNLKSCYMSIHLDLAEVNDRQGIVGSCVDGSKIVEDINGRKLSLPFFREVFAVGIEAPRGDRMSFQKVINFLVWLRRSGFNIGVVSTDQFQSSYVREMLSQQGFNTKKISVDRSEEPYIGLKNVIYDQRIELVKNQLQEDELVNLQRINNRIDHPSDGCFTEDTLISLVDGRQLSISDLFLEQSYRTNWVYTFNEETHRIEPKRIRKVFQTKITCDIVRVTLDNGQTIECTPEHKFMLRDGSYEMIMNLCSGDSLMPLYTKYPKYSDFQYRMYYEPFEDCWHFEHRQFCRNATRKKGTVIHHKNYNKHDNCPSNLVELSKSEHKMIHNNSTLDYSKVSKSVSEYFCRIEGTEVDEDRRRKISDDVKHHNDLYYPERRKLIIQREEDRKQRIEEIEKTYNVDWNKLSNSDKNRYGMLYTNGLSPESTKERYRLAHMKKSVESEERRKKSCTEAIKRRRWYTNGKSTIYLDIDDIVPEGYYPGRTLSDNFFNGVKNRHPISEATKQKHREDTSSRIWITNGSVDKYISNQSEIPEGFWRGRSKKGKNHKIVSIEYIHRPCRVFDLEIEDNHNFALAAGVFVHNSKDISDGLCGSIWNLVEDQVLPQPKPKSVASVIASVNSGQRQYSRNNMPGFNFPTRR